MSRYSGLVHKSDLLKYTEKFPWTSPDLHDEKPRLNGILNRIIHSIRLINFILTERDKQVNTYRKKMSKNEKLDDTFWYIILFTESYFTYTKNLLNAFAELIYEIVENYPDKVNGDFTELWDHIKNNELQNTELRDYFQNEMRWYSILSMIPRNQLVVHDKKTSGYGMNDHGIDVYVGKHGDHDKDKIKNANRLLEKIAVKHTEFKDVRIDEHNFHVAYREIMGKIDLLDQYEIDLLTNAGGIAGFDFPYIPHVTPKIQDFIDFVEKWLANKYQMCPTCQQPTLQVTRMAINPRIMKFDPKNIWFGWKCPICRYGKEFKSIKQKS